jgi:hypothetical protein
LPDIASRVVAKAINGKDINEVIKLRIEKALSQTGFTKIFNPYHIIVGKAGQIPEPIKVNPKEQNRFSEEC